MAVSYWVVGHATDTNETGMHTERDYIKAEWVGHPAQRCFEDCILREWCRGEYGQEVVFVQGVAASPGWTLMRTTEDGYETAAPVTWGGHATATQRIHLRIGRKSSSDPAVAVVSIDDALKPPVPRCKSCGQILPAQPTEGSEL